jgi:hypothetical protein
MTTPKTRDAKGLRITFYLPDPKDAAVLVARAKRSGLTLGQTARLLMLRQAWMNAPTDPMEDRIENADNELAGDWMDLPV